MSYDPNLVRLSRVLEVVLGWDVRYLSLNTTHDEVQLIGLDDDLQPFGFTALIFGDSPAEIAVRFVDMLAEALPTSGALPFWRKPIPVCPAPRHRHRMWPHIVNAHTVTLLCPTWKRPMRRIDLRY